MPATTLSRSPSPARPTPAAAAPVYSLRVLVVDDDRDCAESLADVLRAYGHEARTACTPTTAVIEADSFRPDAVLMDIGIRGMDGYRLARRLCEVLGERPLLVAVTGYGNLEGRSRLEGFDYHFVKPADPAELTGVLATHAGRESPQACGGRAAADAYAFGGPLEPIR